MKITFAAAAIALLVALAIIFGGSMFPGKSTETVTTPTSTAATTTDPVATATSTTATTSSVKLAFLDVEGVTNGKSRGCDKVVLQSITIPATTTPLNAALRALFAEDREKVGTLFSFIARTNNTLHFDNAVLANGTANIYLTGSLSGLAGVCDDPRAQIQIEETALQFPTVKNVKLFLNGKETILTPSEQ